MLFAGWPLAHRVEVIAAERNDCLRLKAGQDIDRAGCVSVINITSQLASVISDRCIVCERTFLCRGSLGIKAKI